MPERAPAIDRGSPKGTLFSVRTMPGLHSVQHYRDEATRLREEARRATTPHYRNRLEKFARIYERLAVSVEREMKPPWPPVGRDPGEDAIVVHR